MQGKIKKAQLQDQKSSAPQRFKNYKGHFATRGREEKKIQKGAIPWEGSPSAGGYAGIIVTQAA